MCQLTTITQALLPDLLAEDPHAPRLVVHATLGRTELSTASLANWSSKVAGLLVDELGAAAGDPVSVRLPAGWQTAPILLGCWWAGMVVTTDDDPDAVAAFVPDSSWLASEPAAELDDADPAGADADTDTAAADAAADEVFVVSGHPLGAPSTTVLAHQRDFTSAVLGQADRFAGRAVDPASPALRVDDDEWSATDLLATARAAAEGFGSGARVLSSSPWTLPEPGLALLLGTLAAGGSLVHLVADAGDPQQVYDAERCTTRWPDPA